MRVYKAAGRRGGAEGGDSCILNTYGAIQYIIFTHINMNLIVYCSPWCRDCHVAKRWLAENNISYEEINIDEEPDAAEEVIRRTGKRAIPQFVLNGQWVQPYEAGEGFKYQEMAELFGIAPKDGPAPAQ